MTGHRILAREIHKGFFFPTLGTNSTYPMRSFHKKLITIIDTIVLTLPFAVWRFDLYLVRLHLNIVKLGMVVHLCNPRTWESGAGELLQVRGQAKTPFQSKNNKYILILWSLWKKDRLTQTREIKEYLSLKEWFSLWVTLFSLQKQIRTVIVLLFNVSTNF